MSEAGKGGGRGRAGRQRRAAGGRHNSIHVRVSDEELAALEAKAVRLRVTVPNLLVQSALHGGGGSLPERHALFRELSAVRLLLIRVGTNVNQLAHHANATEGEILPRTGEALEAAVAAIRQADSVIKALPVPPVRAPSRPTGEPS